MKIKDIFLSFSEDSEDIIGLSHGDYWYKIFILKGKNLMLRYERHHAFRGDTDIGPTNNYTFAAMERYIKIIKMMDPTLEKNLYN